MKYVYTLSDKKQMLEQCVMSIKTLLSSASPDIIVYLTPPYDHRTVSILEKLDIEIVTAENSTDEFVHSIKKPASRNCEKIHLCDVDDDCVFFLDCDTIVTSDPSGILAGDFDFKARGGNKENLQWEDYFHRYGKRKMDWMPNAGCMIFKNGTHKKIKSDWRYFCDKLQNNSTAFPKDQIALALAVSDYDCEKMSSKECCLTWNELEGEATIYHYQTQFENSVITQLSNLKNRFF